MDKAILINEATHVLYTFAEMGIPAQLIGSLRYADDVKEVNDIDIIVCVDHIAGVSLVNDRFCDTWFGTGGEERQFRLESWRQGGPLITGRCVKADDAAVRVDIQYAERVVYDAVIAGYTTMDYHRSVRSATFTEWCAAGKVLDETGKLYRYAQLGVPVYGAFEDDPNATPERSAFWEVLRALHPAGVRSLMRANVKHVATHGTRILR